MTAGTITVLRPRLQTLDERFETRNLPLFVRRTQAVAELLPQLYFHGLAQGDFELALRGLLRDGAPLSTSSIERLRAKWGPPPVPAVVRTRKARRPFSSSWQHLPCGMPLTLTRPRPPSTRCSVADMQRCTIEDRIRWYKGNVHTA